MRRNTLGKRQRADEDICSSRRPTIVRGCTSTVARSGKPLLSESSHSLSDDILVLYATGYATEQSFPYSLDRFAAHRGELASASELRPRPRNLP